MQLFAFTCLLSLALAQKLSDISSLKIQPFKIDSSCKVSKASNDLTLKKNYGSTFKTLWRDYSVPLEAPTPLKYVKQTDNSPFVIENFVKDGWQANTLEYEGYVYTLESIYAMSPGFLPRSFNQTIELHFKHTSAKNKKSLVFVVPFMVGPLQSSLIQQLQFIDSLKPATQKDFTIEPGQLSLKQFWTVEIENLKEGYFADETNCVILLISNKIQSLIQAQFDFLKPMSEQIDQKSFASKENSHAFSWLWVAGFIFFSLNGILIQHGHDQFNIPVKDKAQSFVLVPTNPEKQTLTILDNRTGKTYEVPIENGTVHGIDFQKIKLPKELDGLRVYDPAYLNTAVAKSKITYIDGDQGILRYRGYPIEELAEKSTFLEVSYLLIYGELPDKVQLDHWQQEVMRHTFVHSRVGELMKTFNYDAHPMGMFISGMAAMSTFHPEANPALQGSNLYVNNKRIRNKQILRILGKTPTLAAICYRHRIGRNFNMPRNDLNYTENFLYMLDRLSEDGYRPNPKLAKALDVLFILHADHELNCSTAAMRHIGSSLVDPYSAIAGSAAALYGPLHGGANEAVVRMLESIGSVDNVAEFITAVKNKQKKLMGFGHRVYKNFDPRAKIIRKLAFEVFEVTGKEPLIDIAIELEKRALEDEYFIKRKLYPNVDFYSGLIYKAMGFPLDFFPVLFAIPRVAGWLAHWTEMLDDPDNKIARPRQVYIGEEKRSFVPLEHRDVKNEPAESHLKPLAYHHPFSKRTRAANWGQTKL